MLHAVFLPLFTYTAKLNKAYFLVRAFAAGVVLVTGYVHVLGDAIPLLSDPCLGLSVTYPWALVFASFSSMLAFTLEWNLNQYFTAKLGTSESNSGVIATSVELGLDPEEISEKQREKRRLEYTVISTTFEAGVIFHSIFIGITIGISSSADTVRSLMIALMFHQMCEGLALGVTFVKAEYSVLKYCLLGMLFLVITPHHRHLRHRVRSTCTCAKSPQCLVLGYHAAGGSDHAAITCLQGTAWRGDRSDLRPM